MINLQKGQRIEIGLSKVGVGLGWDPNESTGYDFDLDASAFMLGCNKKLPQDEFFVFYNNQVSPDKAVESSGDDLTGGNSDGGDDETLTVDLAKVDSRIQEIISLLPFMMLQLVNRILVKFIIHISASMMLIPIPISLAMILMKISVSKPLLSLVVSTRMAQNGNSKLWVLATKAVYNISSINM